MEDEDISSGQRVQMHKTGTLVSSPWLHPEFGCIAWVRWDDEMGTSIVSVGSLERE